MPPGRKKKHETAADYWGAWESYDQDQMQGGFTKGILDLRRLFSDHILESIQLGNIAADEKEVRISMLMRGINQLKHPEMQDRYKTILKPSKDQQFDFWGLPYYLQLCLADTAYSNAVDGRAQQRVLDMHTQFQGNVRSNEIIRSLEEKVSELQSQPKQGS